MAKETIVKQGDLFPDVITVVKDENGVVVDLTGVTNVRFFMRSARDPSVVKVNNAAGALDGAGTLGRVKYQWAGTDTDTPGTYEAEFRITPASGDPFRVPTSSYELVIIEPKVG